MGDTKLKIFLPKNQHTHVQLQVHYEPIMSPLQANLRVHCQKMTRNGSKMIIFETYIFKKNFLD